MANQSSWCSATSWRRGRKAEKRSGERMPKPAGEPKKKNGQDQARSASTIRVGMEMLGSELDREVVGQDVVATVVAVAVVVVFNAVAAGEVGGLTTGRKLQFLVRGSWTKNVVVDTSITTRSPGQLLSS
ncbi:hypothetical protein SODALDRAFT_7325 [Sodiomyces alkalinus F11]|uniref:Uncharacterized protein n=1 Tax=Sodiomyces alkalinus (strain CBS 110278 / VKM F-3762 / F11) TaxID=1314773 RepID=A0A3N2Q645_SODAK|nr:hypothetical protein SODALDRAFT_7325 [Sodiomyces alkalinus F11]ROT42095.1 hypothetical protein SODALDRAFT_7325 [Sodiomyces alkalinus F11]